MTEDMMYIVIGVVAFALFFLYDINSFMWKNRGLHSLFLVGNILLIAATAGCFFDGLKMGKTSLWHQLIFGSLAVVQALLLIYTLFFALPFKKTYGQAEEKPAVYMDGIYALCRHPGVIWFFFLYLFLALFTGQKCMAQVCIVYSGLNVLYVLFQDRITFTRTLSGYEEYRKETPFLIPNKKSFNKCIGFFRKAGGK